MWLLYVALVFWAVFCNCRDIRGDRGRDCRWTLRSLTRSRAVGLSLFFLVFWTGIGLGMWQRLSKPHPDRSILLIIPFMIGMQLCLLRRTELYQDFSNVEPFPADTADPERA